MGLFQAWGGKQRVSSAHRLVAPFALGWFTKQWVTSHFHPPSSPNTVDQQLPSSIPCHLHEQVLFKAELWRSPVCHPTGSRLEPRA